METVVFDVYPQPSVVGMASKTVVFDTSENTVVPNPDALILCRRPGPDVSVTKTSGTGLSLVKSIPEPLRVVNSPDTAINPDGSYDYVPQVVGGYGPYKFTLTGADSSFKFNTGTGELSRPPQ